MNWGTKIILAYCLFVIGIMVLVVKSMNQNQELVTSDYYAQELQFQKRIDAESRTTRLMTPVKVSYTEGNINIRFPDDFKQKKCMGSVNIYCPNNQQNDMRSDFALTEDHSQFSILYNTKGMRKVQIDWICDGQTYYTEKTIFIP